MRILLSATLIILVQASLFAQSAKLSGRVEDEETGKPFRGATVSLLSQSDSFLIRIDIAGGDGRFLMPGLADGKYILTVSAAGYQQHVSFLILEGLDKELPAVKLFKQDKNLPGVTIVARIPPVIQNGDTTQYNADRFKVNPDATAEDLIKKMPGITVDKSGTVTAMGEQVKNVTVDGKRFFGDDVTAALRNLPAEVIEKIQVFDRLSEQSQFTGFDDGSGAKGMNIITRSGMRTGQFGKVYGGYGTDSRYNGGGNVSFFKGDRRLSLAGLFNNINQQNFSGEDLFGVMGAGGGRGGGAGGRGGGSGGGNFMVGQQNGISDTKSSGLNYSDKWGDKTEVSGSYFFNHSNTNNDQLSNIQYFISDSSSQFYKEQQASASDNTNHRFNFRFDHKFDSSHSILFTPSVSYQDNNNATDVAGLRSLKDGAPMSSNDYVRPASTKGINTNNNLLYRYSFPRKGRTLSLNVGFGGNTKDGEIFLSSRNEFDAGPISRVDSVKQRTDQNVEGFNYSVSFSYTEPMGKDGQLQFTYTPSVSNTHSDQIVSAFDSSSAKYDRLDTGLSNKFINRVESHTAGLNFRKGTRDNMLTFGLNFRMTDMNSDQEYPSVYTISKSFINLLPGLMWRKKMTSGKNINVYYRANANTPSVSQLQDVVDNSNSLLLSAGNPDLRQQVNHTLGSRYSVTNAVRATSFFASFFTQLSRDYIAMATFTARRDTVLANNVIMKPGSQLSKPVNLNGYASTRLFLTYGLPVKKLKSNININSGLTWSRMPGLANGVEGRSDNYTVTAGAVFSSNISQYVDFTLSYSGSFSTAKNTISPDLNSKYVNNSIGAQCNILSKKGWFINTDLSGQYYSGLSEGFDQGYWLLNAGVGKKFLKNQAGEIKFSVFDILRQNQSITRTVNETSIQDVRNTVLRRYFMLTFTYKLRNFGTPPKYPGRERDREWGMPPGGGGRMNR